MTEIHIGYTGDQITDDVMDAIATTLHEVEENGGAQCRLCPYQADGDSLGVILDKLGRHAETAHNM